MGGGGAGERNKGKKEEMTGNTPVRNLKAKNTMKKIQFKTNINCSACVASVRPHLDRAVGADRWEVDIADRNKILTVRPEEGITVREIAEAVRVAGFKAETI